MKKIFLALLAALFLMSCGTTVVNQVELYGVVEEVLYYNHHKHVKVWCAAKEKYYEVITDKLYQPGDTIRIK